MDFADSEVFYSGWISIIQWSPNKLYVSQELVWWDRWTIDAVMLPFLEFAVKNDVSFNCGEVALIGSTRGSCLIHNLFLTRCYDILTTLEVQSRRAGLAKLGSTFYPKSLQMNYNIKLI